MENSSLWNEAHANVSSAPKACSLYSSANSISEKVLMITGYIVQFILSISGNVVVIFVFCKSHNLRKNPVNLFIVNMAVSDLMVPLFVIPRRVKDVYLGWSPWLVDGVLGDILCKVANFADEVSVAVSSLCMLFIAAERFWSIFFRKKVTAISQKNTSKFIAFTWVFSCLFYSFYFFAYKLVKSKNSITCNYDLPQLFENWEDLWRADRMATLTVFGIIPFIAMTVFYVAIIIKLAGTKRLFALRVPSEAERKREKHKQRTIFMLVTLVFIFFVTWTPYYAHCFNQYFAETKWPCHTRKVLYSLTNFLSYSYIVLNPVIYYVFNKRFRQGLHEILYKLPCF